MNNFMMEDDDYIQKYKNQHNELCKEIGEICKMGYPLYLETHLTDDMDEDECFDVFYTAAYRYPLCFSKETEDNGYTYEAQLEFHKEFTPPTKTEYMHTTYSSDTDEWEDVIEKLKLELDAIRDSIRYDIMVSYKNHTPEDVWEIIYIGNHGDFSFNKGKLFPTEIPLSKIKELKSTAEDYYQNYHWWTPRPDPRYADNETLIFFYNIKTTLQSSLKNAGKADEKEERERLRKELDEFIN